METKLINVTELANALAQDKVNEVTCEWTVKQAFVNGDFKQGPSKEYQDTLKIYFDIYYNWIMEYEVETIK